MRIARHSERGVGRLTLLVFGTIFGAVLYAAYKIIPFFYYYYETQNHFEAIVKLAGYETDAYIRDRLWKDIKKAGIPVNPEGLRIYKQGGNMKISMKYKEVFYITFRGKEYVIYEFPFHAQATGPYWVPK